MCRRSAERSMWSKTWNAIWWRPGSPKFGNGQGDPPRCLSGRRVWEHVKGGLHELSLHWQLALHGLTRLVLLFEKGLESCFAFVKKSKYRNGAHTYVYTIASSDPLPSALALNSTQSTLHRLRKEVEKVKVNRQSTYSNNKP